MRWLAIAIVLSACAPVMTVSPLPLATKAQELAAVEEGMASWYGPNFAGRRTANGETFDPSQLTAAHRTLPFGTLVKVTNLNNSHSVIVRINDRGPFKDNRVIDLSRAAAESIRMIGSGIAPVRVEILEAVLPKPDPGFSAYRAAAESSLSTYDIITDRHKLGELLVLVSARYPQGILVRVASTKMPQAGVDVFLSSDLYNILGETVIVEQASLSAVR